MNFKKRLDIISILQELITDHKTIEGIQYDEDISNRVIRDYMFSLGLLRSSVAGCYKDDAQDYFAEQARTVLSNIIR